MPSIARKNLFEDIPRFLVAQAGIMFAVSLITIQKGILDGFTRSTVLLIEQSTADLWVADQSMEYLELTTSLTVEALKQARQVQGVDRAEALSIQGVRWRGPNGRIDGVRIYAFNPDGQLFANWKLPQGKLGDLSQPYTIMVDESNTRELGLNQIGDTGEVSSLPAKFVGTTRDTQSMTSSAYLFASLETANAYLFGGLSPQVNCKIQTGNLECTNEFKSTPKSATKKPPAPPRKLNLADPISYVLIKAAVGQDTQALKQRLESAIPGTFVHTKAEMAERTSTYWRERTGVGFILGLGAAVGFVVGMVVVSQILYSSVSDHLKEFGTLKAMGASDWVIYRVITEQALWMAVLGYLPSMALCVGLGTWTMAAKGIMILITPATAFGVFGITVFMCVGSALFAIQKVTHIDPAIVFKA
ncbi:ABC transporter permease [Kovacikia minuta CCNUW1]|uniref:FtsX-like permease family protein n=1 Tax=Kovacikia minuta TaxID=2931930 RepID=UPI001CCD1B14|nr:FtsX-like permease family protein [Kovacikia minuta]UBF28270.1 ABC transporter permease [Kovacikia minuta CCNUW1]